MKYLWLVIAIGVFCPAVASAAEPEKKSLDDQLLDDLSTDLLPATKPAAKPPSEKRQSDQPADPALDQQLLDDLIDGEDIQFGEQPDPLTRISQQMRNVETLIGRRDTSVKTQEMQKQILSDLDQLLEQTKKQCQGQCNKPSSSSQASNSPPKPSQSPGSDPMNNKPAKDSSEELRKPGENKVAQDEAMNQLVKEVWGHLPDKVRDQMQNVGVEQFLPKYEKLIEAYYKRLAEEK